MNEDKYTVKSLVKDCLKISNGYESLPFNKDLTKDKIVWHVVKHSHNDKMYAMVFEKEHDIFLNVKLTVEHGEELRHLKGVQVGYHMNKKHWNTIDVNNTELSTREIRNVLFESAKLTE